MPHVAHRNPDGQYVHFCTDCGYTLHGHGHERYVVWVCRCAKPQRMRTPTVTVGDKASAPAEPRAMREKPTPRPPCAFLGSATGKQHKVGCVDHYLDEHYCSHPGRELVELPPTKRRPELRVLTPKAVPAGRCRDLEVYRGGVVACVDCPLYRAGLLPGPLTQENAALGRSLEGS